MKVKHFIPFSCSAIIPLATVAILVFLNLQTNNDNKNLTHRKPALGGVGTIFQKGYSKEQEFDVVIRMDGKLVNTRVYGKGSLAESREACEKNNASLPWKTFSIESVNIRGAGSEASSYIKSRVFWLSTTIEHPVNMTSLTSEIGGPISSVLKDLEHQIAGLLINSHPNINATYCAISHDLSKTRRSRFICANDTFDEHGRVVLYTAFVPHCEVLKLDREFIQKYKLMQQTFSEITYTSNNFEFANIFRTGWNIDDFDAGNHGIEWCANNPRMAIGLLQNTHKRVKEILPGFIETKAYAACIKNDLF